MDNLETAKGEIQRAVLALLVPLLKEEQFIGSIRDIKQLLKLIPFLMQDNNTLLANAI